MLNQLAHIRPVPASEADPFEANVGNHGSRILIVEDHEEAATDLSELLGIDGFRVSRAADGPTALATARDEVIDAVVLDVRLPGMDGFEVCRRLRADQTTTSLVIVMLTGLDDTQSKLEGLGSGADDYLVKPVAWRELATRLRNLLGARHSQLRELREHRLQAIGDIANAVCHEINNPIIAALGGVDSLLMTHQIAPDIRRDLEECQKHLIRIGRLLVRLDEVHDRTIAHPRTAPATDPH